MVGNRRQLQGSRAVFMGAVSREGTHRRPQKRLARRLEEIAKAVGGGYCRLQMPLGLARTVRETVVGRRLSAPEGGLYLPPYQCIPEGGCEFFSRRGCGACDESFFLRGVGCCALTARDPARAATHHAPGPALHLSCPCPPPLHLSLAAVQCAMHLLPAQPCRRRGRGCRGRGAGGP